MPPFNPYAFLRRPVGPIRPTTGLGALPSPLPPPPLGTLFGLDPYGQERAYRPPSIPFGPPALPEPPPGFYGHPEPPIDIPEGYMPSPEFLQGGMTLQPQAPLPELQIPEQAYQSARVGAPYDPVKEVAIQSQNQTQYREYRRERELGAKPTGFQIPTVGAVSEVLGLKEQEYAPEYEGGIPVSKRTQHDYQIADRIAALEDMGANDKRTYFDRESAPSPEMAAFDNELKLHREHLKARESEYHLADWEKEALKTAAIAASVMPVMPGLGLTSRALSEGVPFGIGMAPGMVAPFLPEGRGQEASIALAEGGQILPTTLAARSAGRVAGAQAKALAAREAIPQSMVPGAAAIGSAEVAGLKQAAGQVFKGEIAMQAPMVAISALHESGVPLGESVLRSLGVDEETAQKHGGTFELALMMGGPHIAKWSAESSIPQNVARRAEGYFKAAQSTIGKIEPALAKSMGNAPSREGRFEMGAARIPREPVPPSAGVPPAAPTANYIEKTGPRMWRVVEGRTGEPIESGVSSLGHAQEVLARANRIGVLKGVSGNRSVEGTEAQREAYLQDVARANPGEMFQEDARRRYRIVGQASRPPTVPSPPPSEKSPEAALIEGRKAEIKKAMSGGQTISLSGTAYGDYLVHPATPVSGESGYMVTRISDGETVSGERSIDRRMAERTARGLATRGEFRPPSPTVSPLTEAPPVVPKAKEPWDLKVGDEIRVAGIESNLVDSQTIDNVRYELYGAASAKDKRAVVIVRDSDTGEAVHVNTYPTYEQATREYADTVRRVGGIVPARAAPKPAAPPGQERPIVTPKGKQLTFPMKPPTAEEARLTGEAQAKAREAKLPEGTADLFGKTGEEKQVEAIKTAQTTLSEGEPETETVSAGNMAIGDTFTHRGKEVRVESGPTEDTLRIKNAINRVVSVDDQVEMEKGSLSATENKTLGDRYQKAEVERVGAESEAEATRVRSERLSDVTSNGVRPSLNIFTAAFQRTINAGKGARVLGMLTSRMRKSDDVAQIIKGFERYIGDLSGFEEYLAIPARYRGFTGLTLDEVASTAKKRGLIRDERDIGEFLGSTPRWKKSIAATPKVAKPVGPLMKSRIDRAIAADRPPNKGDVTPGSAGAAYYEQEKTRLAANPSKPVTVPPTAEASQVAREEPAAQSVRTPPSPAQETPYSKESLKTMGATDEQVALTDVLVKAIGLDVSKVVMTRGGSPGKGALKQGGANLVAAHNLTANNVRHAAKMGGLPVPSVAIINVDTGNFEGYGDITLLGSKELVTPSRTTKVLNADAYSPRYPAVKHFLDAPSEVKLGRFIGDIYARIDSEKTKSFSQHTLLGNLEGEGVRVGMKQSEDAKFAFLIEKGVADKMTLAGKDQSGDRYAVREAIANDPSLKAEFEEWVDKSVTKLALVEKEKIFTGFTDIGNKRYLPHNLDTVVQILKKGLRSAEGFDYGVGNIRALAAKQFRSIREIQAARGDIISKEAMDKIKDDVNGEFLALSGRMHDARVIKVDEYRRSEAMSDDLKTMAEGDWKHLREMYPTGQPFQEMRIFLDKLRTLPTEYFEAKIRRAVGLNEFRSAVVPENTPQDVIDALKTRGLEVVTYPKGEGNRAKTIRETSQSADILFQHGQKGAVEFLADGKTLVHALKNPDFSTAVHEILGHVARRQLFDRNLTPEQRRGITDEDIATAENWAGAKDGRWTRTAEERFARGVERYLRDGKAPTANLEPIFSKVREWMKEIYRRITGSPIDIEISPAMRQVFDRLFTRAERMKMEKEAAQPIVPVVAPPGKPIREPRTVKPKAAKPVGPLMKSRIDIIGKQAVKGMTAEELEKLHGEYASKIPLVRQVLDAAKAEAKRRIATVPATEPPPLHDTSGLSDVDFERYGKERFPGIGNPIPEMKRLPETGQFPAVLTDDGSIFYGDRYNYTHILMIRDMGIPPERIRNGGWLIDGVYNEQRFGDAEAHGEAARAYIRAGQFRAERMRATASVPSEPPPAPPARPEAAERPATADVFLERMASRESQLNAWDELVESGLTPEQVSNDFWNYTYPKMPETGRRRIHRIILDQTGFKPGDVSQSIKGVASEHIQSWKEAADSGIQEFWGEVPEDYGGHGLPTMMLNVMHVANRQLLRAPIARGRPEIESAIPTTEPSLGAIVTTPPRAVAATPPPRKPPTEPPVAAAPEPERAPYEADIDRFVGRIESGIGEKARSAMEDIILRTAERDGDAAVRYSRDKIDEARTRDGLPLKAEGEVGGTEVPEGTEIIESWVPPEEKPLLRMGTPPGWKAKPKISVRAEVEETQNAPSPTEKAPPAPTSEQEARENLNAAIDKAPPPKKPPATPPGTAPGEPPPRKPSSYAFEDTDVETRVQSAKTLPKESLGRRVHGWLREQWHKMSRDFERLPSGAKYAEEKFKFRQLLKYKGIADEHAVRDVDKITRALDEDGYDLFWRKVLLDDLASESGKGRSLPFGFTTESLAKEKARIDTFVDNSPIVKASIDLRKAAWVKLVDEYTEAMKAAGKDVTNILTNKDYFRHIVLKYADAKSISGTGQRLRLPVGRGFLKARKGSEFDILTDYLSAEHQVMAQMGYDLQVAKAIAHVENSPHNIAAKVKANAKEQELLDWHDAIPEGYVAWQAREGNVFYMADSVPHKMAEQLLEGLLTEAKITKNDIRKVLAMGGKFKEIVIPDELAATLDNLGRPPSDNPLASFSRKSLVQWKELVLHLPTRVVKYTLRNLTGDADAAFAGNPSAFLKTKQALGDIYDVFVRRKDPSGEFAEWANRGGMGSTAQAQELGEIKMLDRFSRLSERVSPAGRWNLWKRYWNGARTFSDARESILRYSAYLDYLEQMKSNQKGEPKNFGASVPEEIMALKDVRDRAFALSNDLLGAYDKVGVYGKALREHMWPFWSFAESNFRRYTQMIRNAARDGKATATIGRALGAKTASTAIRLGAFSIKATGLWTIAQIWNNTMFKDEEDDLSPDVRARPHIILGRDSNGKVISFNRFGSLGDFLEWFGLDAAPRQVDDWFKGRKTTAEIATDMAKSPLNKIAQGATPMIKVPAEILTRRRLFPDAFNPSTIRDRGRHLAETLGMGKEYAAVSGLPGEPYLERIPDLFVYRTDPLESAYHYIWDEKNRFLQKIGKGRDGFMLSDRGNALYNFKMALRYGDNDGQDHWLQQYIALGGTNNGVTTALGNMEPLHGLTKDEQSMFVAGLQQDQRDRLVKALMYYNSVLLGHGAPKVELRSDESQPEIEADKSEKPKRKSMRERAREREMAGSEK